MKVSKFGGSSLADAGRIEQVCRIAAADSERRVVVVSAPGKRHPRDTKVTDLLIALADHVVAGRDSEGAFEAVMKRYREIGQGLELSGSLIEELALNLRKRLELPVKPVARFMDALKAAGEDYCARLVAAALRDRGVPAEYMCPRQAGMKLEGDFGDGQVMSESYADLAAALKNCRRLVVFPGFYGATPEGETITFSRGGSDITGAILAAAVDAEEYENFTDVDGVFCVNPSLVPEAWPIPELTYREMRELAYSEFNVFHEDAVMPAIRNGVPIHIRNTSRPESTGTRIMAHRKLEQAAVAGIAGLDGFCAVYLSKFLMNREIGFGRHVLSILEEEKLPFEHMPSGIDDLSIILESSLLSPRLERRIVKRFREELAVDNVEVEHNLALIVIVGEGMHYSVGMAARATGALAGAGVNIEMMNQGSSEISMMFGVKAADRPKALRALFEAFFKERLS